MKLINTPNEQPRRTFSKKSFTPKIKTPFFIKKNNETATFKPRKSSDSTNE
ncbi:hypothetical protein BSPA111_31680 [Buttiauxella sp. A111]|nr:hypothetical protein BSPA111_31680 [Buttiauxella sp. A111]